MGCRAAQSRPKHTLGAGAAWAVRKMREGTHMSANLMEVPAPISGNWKTPDCGNSMVRNKEGACEVRNKRKDFAWWFFSTSLLSHRWQCSNRPTDTQMKTEGCVCGSMNSVLLRFNVSANPYAWYKKPHGYASYHTRAIITLAAGGEKKKRFLGLLKLEGIHIQKDTWCKITDFWEAKGRRLGHFNQPTISLKSI